MANENDMKTSNAAGPTGTESPVESPVEVPALSSEAVYVYAIACGDCVKIGLSNDPEQRLRTLTTGMKDEARLIGSRAYPNRLYAKRAEAILHWSLMAKRVRARSEWYRMTPAQALAALSRVKLPAIVV